MHVKTLGRTTLRRLLRDRSGLSNIEYGLLLGLLAVTSVGTLEVLGVSVSDTFTGTGEAVAENREAFNPTASGTPDSGSNPNDADEDTNDGSTPDEPPVAAADMPMDEITEIRLEGRTPDEPPVAAMKADPGS